MLGKSLKIAALLMLMALAAAAQTIPAGTRLTVRVGSEISSALPRLATDSTPRWLVRWWSMARPWPGRARRSEAR